VKAKSKLSLFHVHAQGRMPQPVLRRFRDALRSIDSTMGEVTKQAFDLPHGLFCIDVTDDDERHVVGCVEATIKIENAFARETLDRLSRADDRAPVRVSTKRTLEQCVKHLLRGRVLAALPFFEHDCELFLELGGIEGGVAHRIR
jgi:hypothetical protein